MASVVVLLEGMEVEDELEELMLPPAAEVSSLELPHAARPSGRARHRAAIEVRRAVRMGVTSLSVSF
jgi:hypothetical protein